MADRTNANGREQSRPFLSSAAVIAIKWRGVFPAPIVLVIAIQIVGWAKAHQRRAHHCLPL
jgi:hypothetical protein